MAKDARESRAQKLVEGLAVEGKGRACNVRRELVIHARRENKFVLDTAELGGLCIVQVTEQHIRMRSVCDAEKP